MFLNIQKNYLNEDSIIGFSNSSGIPFSTFTGYFGLPITYYVHDDNGNWSTLFNVDVKKFIADTKQAANEIICKIICKSATIEDINKLKKIEQNLEYWSKNKIDIDNRNRLL